jgi:glycosyltransferase involved in cell wall biosynthesis
MTTAPRVAPAEAARRPADAWHLITGEYPPQPGGISDYTLLVASGLAEAGGEVHVWAPPAGGDATAVPGVTVHRGAGSWSGADLARLDAALDGFPCPRRLLVQYVPNAYGRRGMNLDFGRWLRRRARRGDSVRTMFHEVRYILQPGDRLARRLLVAVQKRMARMILGASSHAYITVPAWAELLREAAPGRLPPIAVAPVPSTIPAVDDPAGVAEVRRRYAPGGEAIVGAFSTFRPSVEAILAGVLPGLLRRPGRVGLLLGRNGEAVAARIAAGHPGLSGRLFATGGLPPEDVSRHLQAAELLIQADAGGLCAKQTTTMAALANGRPIVAGAGRLTEPSWAEDRCVALAATAEPADLLRVAEACLADPAERARLGEAARSAYARRFSIGRTVAVLTGADAGPG